MSGVEVVCPGDVLATTVRFLVLLPDEDQQQPYSTEIGSCCFPFGFPDLCWRCSAPCLSFLAVYVYFIPYLPAPLSIVTQQPYIN